MTDSEFITCFEFHGVDKEKGVMEEIGLTLPEKVTCLLKSLNKGLFR